MPNYCNGKIYKLVNNIDEKIYIGSTTVQLAKRLYGHKADAKRKSNIKVYQHLNSIGWENVSIILIENHECKSKEELIKRERYWYEQLKPELNHEYPGRTQKECYEMNREYRLKKQKEYDDNHKEHRKEVQKIYYENNKNYIIERNMDYYYKKHYLTNNKDGGSP